jgi:hypothetical protein
LDRLLQHRGPDINCDIYADAEDHGDDRDPNGIGLRLEVSGTTPKIHEERIANCPAADETQHKESGVNLAVIGSLKTTFGHRLPRSVEFENVQNNERNIDN